MSTHGNDLRPFDVSLPMVLLRARESAIRLFRQVLTKHGLTEQQWRVLRALGSAPGPMEVSMLVETTSLLAPSVTRILAHLGRHNLIDRKVAAHDQRRSMISLSIAGVELVDAVAPETEAVYGLIEQRFGSERLGALIEELTTLTTLLNCNDGHETTPSGT